MKLYGYVDMHSLLAMPAITFLTLLNEGHKLDIYDKRLLIGIVSYPHMEADGREQLDQALALPDDMLADILEDEKVDDIGKFKDLFGEANGN